MKKNLFLFIVLALFSTTHLALAQGSTGGGLTNPLAGQGSLESFLMSILDFVIRIGAIAVVLMLVYTGYKFVEAQGAPDKIAEARRMLIWTVIGALILLGAKAIALGIQATVDALG
jgi:heme/copper-type cytochrome/quinol oxidase subunit 2